MSTQRFAPYQSLSVITAAELRFGAAKSGSARIPVLPLAVPADAEYRDIRSQLEAARQPIGPNDLLIAAHVRASRATVVTANTAEFRRVPDLSVENWIA
jgi:tRNA(fMet)-specific endonuclease VapC